MKPIIDLTISMGYTPITNRRGKKGKVDMEVRGRHTLDNRELGPVPRGLGIISSDMILVLCNRLTNALSALSHGTALCFFLALLT